MRHGKWLAVSDPNEAMRELIRKNFAGNIVMDAEELISLRGVTMADLEKAKRDKREKMQE